MDSLPIHAVSGGGFLVETSTPTTFVLCVLPVQSPAARVIDLPAGAKLTSVVALDQSAEGRASAESLAERAGLPKIAVYPLARFEERQTFGPLALLALEDQPGVLSVSWATRPDRALLGARVDLPKFAANRLGRPATHVFGGLALGEGADEAQWFLHALRLMNLPSLVIHRDASGMTPDVLAALEAAGVPLEIVG